MGEHAIDGLEVLFGLVVELLGLSLEFLETTFGIDVDSIFGMLADVEFGLELLWGLRARYILVLEIVCLIKMACLDSSAARKWRFVRARHAGNPSTIK